MRTSELARSVGVSTQTVRNLEDRAVLPPAARSDSGYRRYTHLHLVALRAYADLSKAFGPAAAGTIQACATRGDNDAALGEVLRLVSCLHRDSELLDELRESLRRAPHGRRAAAPGGPRSITEVARHLGIRPSTLRVWERESLISPRRDTSGYRTYHTDDVQQAITVQALRGAGMGVPRIREVLAGATSGSNTQDLLDALDRREIEIRAHKHLAARAVSSLHQYLEISQTESIDVSGQDPKEHAHRWHGRAGSVHVAADGPVGQAYRAGGQR